MPDRRFGSLGDAKTAVRSYVQDRLAAAVTAVDSETVLQLDVDFARFLHDRGIDQNLASELAAAQYGLLERKVTEHVAKWADYGLSPPVGFHIDRERTLVTWRHERFEELTGFVPLPARHFEISEWVSGHSGRPFLLPCACYLTSLGCDPIFITDGSGDEGIDLIGLIRTGPLRSTAIYVQAKSQGRISGDELLREFGKFSALPQTGLHMRYLEALGVPQRRDGANYVYFCLVNGEFEFAAETHGRNLGALLRSRRHIADQLAQTYTRDRLNALAGEIEIPKGADLTRNLAALLAA